MTNALMNSREWYKENKSRYEEYLLSPMKELVAALTPFMKGVDDQLICEPRVGGSISRLYRDARFSKNKGIFREAMWCLFVRDKKIYHGLPSFFFEVSPSGFTYGCGYYVASGESMAILRELILKKSPKAQRALKAYAAQDVFSLEDCRYKRTKHKDQPENLREWLDQRSLCLIARNRDFDLLYSPELKDKLIEDFSRIVPVYDFMLFAESMK